MGRSAVGGTDHHRIGRDVGSSQGRSIYYVRIEGGGGLRNFPKLRTAVLIGCVKCELRGGGGLKSKNFCERNKWMPPKLKPIMKQLFLQASAFGAERVNGSLL